MQFPDDVQRDLVWEANLQATVTNSDLEQAALLAQLDVMTSTHDIRCATLENFCDNTPAVSRARKGAVSSNGPAACLCQIASEHQRLHRCCHRATCLPGPDNVMADDPSRLQHLADLILLSHCEQHHPLESPWRLLHLSNEKNSRLISTLQCKSPTKPMSSRHATLTTPSFDEWTEFCHRLKVPPSLSTVTGEEAKVSCLLVFLRCSRHGQTGQSVQANTVVDAPLAVGKGISDLGEPDPRKQAPGSKANHPPLAAFLKSLSDKDAPSQRAFPTNIAFIRAMQDALDTAHPVHGPANLHAIDLTIVAF